MIILNSEHLQKMKTHAQNSYPYECCGIILGTITPEFKRVLEIQEAENSWSEQIVEMLPLAGGTKKERFLIAPAILLQAQKQARDRQVNIIGIYHSHPDHSAMPSECDRLMAWPEYSYLIISVDGEQAQEILCWQLDEDHQFQPEIITIKPN